MLFTTKKEADLLELPELSTRTYAITMQDIKNKQKMIQVNMGEARDAILKELGISGRTLIKTTKK